MLDPDAANLLDALRSAGGPPIESLSPDEARSAMAAMAALSPAEGAEVASVETRIVAGVRCQVVTPIGSGPWPTLVWFHGGGWVLGNATESLHTARDLAAGAGCVVVSADYRLAPEHRFPAAIDDALAVTRAVVAEATTPVAVGGDSAGGNLAAVVAWSVPGLVHQLLAYPVTDATMSQPSYSTMADGYLLTAAMMRWFVDHYAGGADRSDPRMSPLAAPAGTLSRACPAQIVLAGYDPLHDEGEAYGRRLADAGVAVEVCRYDGQMHGMLTMGAIVPTGAEALSSAADRLSRAFAAAR